MPWRLCLRRTLLFSPCVTLGKSVVSLGLNSLTCMKYEDVTGLLESTEGMTSIPTWHIAATQEFFLSCSLHWSPGRRVQKFSRADGQMLHCLSISCETLHE